MRSCPSRTWSATTAPASSPSVTSTSARPWRSRPDERAQRANHEHRGDPQPAPEERGRRLRITRLYLRNYRVFADELDLQVPAGLVGIYGVNGAGKSALVESIRWSLWGKARTSKDAVRTSDVNS